MFDVPEYRDFRNYVNRLPKNRDSVLIKSFYLMAARCNELLTHVSPSDKSTKALGQHSSWSFLYWSPLNRVTRDPENRVMVFAS